MWWILFSPIQGAMAPVPCSKGGSGLCAYSVRCGLCALTTSEEGVAPFSAIPKKAVMSLCLWSLSFLHRAGVASVPVRQ